MQMNHSTASMVAAVALLAGASVAWAQTAGPGGIIVPSSSIAGPNDLGVKAHTNTLIKAVPANFATATPAIPGAPGPPFAGYGYNTPASLGCVYSLVLPQAPGCNPNVAYMNPSGGSRSIAIVDAFDNPNAIADFVSFETQFGLTPGALVVTYAQPGGVLGACTAANPGPIPPVDPTGGWEIEESLDVQWAAAMAPGALIFLVEAQSNSYNDLFCAISYAQSLVSGLGAGGGEISMSWGGGEFGGETLYDLNFGFSPAKLVYVASSGDSPGTEYPCTSPEVVCAGGTSVGRNPTYLSFTVETAWQVAGGGPSAVFGGRNAPDVSAIADPDTGVWVLDTNPVPGPGWYIVGGTSVASPVWAGIINRAGSFLNSGSAGTSGSELHKLYADSSVSGDFTDITIGSCGPYAGYLAAVGWDYCTGRGSPRGYSGK
jgi:kumamolisin